VPVAGGNGVGSDATAVVANFTATGATDGTFLTVYPGMGQRPGTSNLNVAPADTVANAATVALGQGGVSIYNEAGTVHVIGDVAGFYAPDPA
jgi:hypothetical protein